MDTGGVAATAVPAAGPSSSVATAVPTSGGQPSGGQIIKITLAEVHEWLRVAVATLSALELAIHFVLRYPIPMRSNEAQLAYGLTIQFFRAVVCDTYERYIRRARKANVKKEDAEEQALAVLGVAFEDILSESVEYGISELMVEGVLVIVNGSVQAAEAEASKSAVRNIAKNMRHALAHADYESVASFVGTLRVPLATLRNRDNFSMTISVVGMDALARHAFDSVIATLTH